MENKQEDTDAGHIKPVSSLRSHFEGLRHQQAQQEETQSTSRLSPLPIRHLESSNIPQIRQSLDLPRPVSPWASPDVRRLEAPRTPVIPGSRSESPPKNGHKRPLSMQIQPSPLLTPAVNIESPRSPPSDYFDRSVSRSPERADITPFNKVRDLISQHSSAHSSRPSTPRENSTENVHTNERKHSVVQAAVSALLKVETPTSAPASKPPPVNRADKPKIPPKPQALPVHDVPAALFPDQSRSSFEAKVSPFNTPPSSDGLPSPDEVPAAPLSVSKPSQPGSTKVSNGAITQMPPPSLPTAKANDPRSMGFAKPSFDQDRKDPGNLGFGNPASNPQTRDIVVPARANTVSERSTPRDPRDTGFSTGMRPPQRVVSENIHTSSNIPALPAHSTRDPRTLGFSSTAGVTETIAEESMPGFPPRRTVKAPPPPRPSEETKYIPPRIAEEPKLPPPRPSEDSKRILPRTVRQVSPGVVPDRSTKPAAAPVVSRAPTVPADGRFPPPPKRYTDEMAKPQNLQHQSASDLRPPSSNEVSRPPSTGPYDQDSDVAEGNSEMPTMNRTEYPDTTQANRRPPVYKSGLRKINVKSDSRVFDVCGQFVCTAGYVTRVFDMSIGEQIMGINHGETVKITAVAFKPAADLEGEGKRIWTGNNAGELHEVDVATHSTIATSSAHNRREIVQILRHKKDLWTLDDDGKLCVWPADETGAPNLKYSHVAHRVQKGHTFALVEGDKLWLATGKEIRIYKPGNESSFTALTKPLTQSGTGDITSGTVSKESGGRVYFGHTDGRVTMYSTRDYSCIGTVKASDYKINGLAFVGNKLWAAYKTGKIYVYDTSHTPWKVQKDWTAHDGPAAGVLLDPSSIWTLGRLQVTTVGHDNHVCLWDGMLEDDWIESAMHTADVRYCHFRELRAAVVTWNVGATTPYELRNDFIADAIHAEDPPEILIFGFQEVVDLEDRAVTAKSIFGFGKKKDVVNTEQHQSRVYREWRDYLSKFISRYTGASYVYSELHTSNLIGLFQCIFIRQEERAHVRDICGINVKCGLKGHYGNKGALVTRFILDDSTLCFVNCHLAAGQSSTSQRNNDIANILESESMPAERDDDTRMSIYIGGGDGSQILDHEVCILNGDLNYRIDTIPRDTVINMIKRNEFGKLLDRDQLLVSRRRVSGFRLGAFTELPITFAPTYKYDVGTDIYDSSDKKRAPAWCDRLLYRGPGRIKQMEYLRHEVKVSDHRPVSGLFKIRVKTIDPRKRAQIKEECHEKFLEVKRALAEAASINYLVNSLGVSEKEARALLKTA